MLPMLIPEILSIKRSQDQRRNDDATNPVSLGKSVTNEVIEGAVLVAHFPPELCKPWKSAKGDYLKALHNVSEITCGSFSMFFDRQPFSVEGIVHCAFEFGGRMMAVEAALDSAAEWRGACLPAGELRSAQERGSWKHGGCV